MPRNNFPNHPVIDSMERDGCIAPAPGYVFLCDHCGAPIYSGDPYYDVADKLFCTECSRAALEEATCYA